MAPFVTGPRSRDTDNWAPRIGFNWSTPDARTSVRGGYGIFYDRVTLQIQSLERGLDGRALPIEVRAGNRPVSLDSYPVIGWTTCPNLYCLSGTYRDGFFASPAIARHVGCVRAHSIAMEPDPAPTSHRSCPGSGANVDSEIARTSRLVNWPSVSYASSGSPGTRE